MINLIKRIADLSPKKRNPLSQELNNKGGDTSRAPISSQSEESHTSPLSIAQQRLWLFDQLVSKSSVNNIPLAVHIIGQLDVDVLEQCFNEIIRRHEILRTSFLVMEEHPAQIIMPESHLTLPRQDLRVLSQAEREKIVQQLIALEIKQPFDLTQCPLLRVSLFQLGAEEYIFLLTIHQIVLDHWSLRIFLHELAVLYQSFATGMLELLPELPIQYADFVYQQRQWLQTEALETQLAYWRQQLNGAPPVLQLPTDRPRPAIATYQGAHYTFHFPQTLTEALKALSQREGTMLFITLLAAVKTLLYRYTSQEDLVVGTPINNRARAELEGLIGFFANTLVLRTDLSGDPSFREVLERVHKVASDAYAHQDLPFERLIEELQPQRDLSYNPLFQVMVALRDTAIEVLELTGLTLKPLPIEGKSTPFDLTFEFSETSAGLAVHLEYNTDLFDAITITRLVGHLQTLLEGIVANPDQQIGKLPLLTEAERQQLLVEWDDTRMDYPQEQCIHQLFEAQVERTPDSVALIFEDQQLTYRELNRQANKLAHYLRQLGVGPEVLVGICMERSLEMVVGVLGILKAGGAYVPLDPTYPSDRIAYMLENSQAPVLVTQQHLKNELPTTDEVKVVCLNTDMAVLAQQSDADPIHATTPDNLAYVIYTSGSTGRPKGVQILHRAVVNFLISMRHQPGLNADDTLLAVTTLSFDIAALELFLPLIIGARVIVASRNFVANGVLLAEELEHSRATVMQATPVTWRILLAAGWQGKPQLKILCGGEALPMDLAQQLLPKARSLWNLYGPTETTIWSSVCKIEPGDDLISIGRPIANTQIYLLDAYLQLVPIGVPGELFIGGTGLARGYLNRPDLTAERFIIHPFSDEPGARLYKTGDLARYRPDGTIELIGRLDHQVKIRGFRIELGEIEYVLSQHPDVRQCVAIVREDTPGNKRLVAYVLTREGSIPSISDLRNRLKEQLPDYMIPSAFVLLTEFPLTPNGKVDRKALPLPDTANTARDAVIAEPSTLTEKRLGEIVSSLLGLEQVGRDDNFFLIGGNSLMGMQFVARVAAAFGIDLPLRTLFNTPTVRLLAAEIERLIFIKLEAVNDEEVQSLLKQAKGVM